MDGIRTENFRAADDAACGGYGAQRRGVKLRSARARYDAYVVEGAVGGNGEGAQGHAYERVVAGIEPSGVDGVIDIVEIAQVDASFSVELLRLIPGVFRGSLKAGTGTGSAPGERGFAVHVQHCPEARRLLLRRGVEQGQGKVQEKRQRNARPQSFAVRHAVTFLPGGMWLP